MKRLIDWLVGGSSRNESLERPATTKAKGNIFLGRDLDKQTPPASKVVRWTDVHDSGSDTTNDRR
jgi:hypothetical protein